MPFRLTEAEAASIGRAASVRGQSRVAFVQAAAKQAAADALSEASSPRISAEGFRAFMRAVSAPANSVPAMVASLCRKALWDEGALNR
jgi:uncharacterized protein (DUF1778 family)